MAPRPPSCTEFKAARAPVESAPRAPEVRLDRFVLEMPVISLAVREAACAVRRLDASSVVRPVSWLEVRAVSAAGPMAVMSVPRPAMADEVRVASCAVSRDVTSPVVSAPASAEVRPAMAALLRPEILVEAMTAMLVEPMAATWAEESAPSCAVVSRDTLVDESAAISLVVRAAIWAVVRSVMDMRYVILQGSRFKVLQACILESGVKFSSAG